MRSDLLAFCERVAGQDAASQVLNVIQDQKSYGLATIHPYGFYIWKLPSISPHYALRVHVWLPATRNRQVPDWPPHSHNSNLHSFVLAGKVSNLTWQWVNDPSGQNQLYDVGYEGPLSKLTRTNEIGRLEAKTEETFLPASDYLVPTGIFHASEVVQGLSSVTLVLLEKETTGVSQVVGETSGHPNYIFDRLDASESEQREARGAAFEAIMQI